MRERGEEILLRAIGGRELFGAPPEVVFQPLALGDVAHDQREALQLALAAAPHRRDDDVRVERRPAAPHAQALAGEPAALFGAAEVLGGNVEIALGRRVEAGEAAADDLVGGVAEQPFGAGIPAGDLALRRQHADGVVLHAVEQQAQPVLGLAQLVGVRLELGVQRDDAAVGFLELGLEIAERARQLRVLLVQIVACGVLDVAARLGGLARRRDGAEAIGGARRKQRPQADRQLRELLGDLDLVDHRCATASTASETREWSGASAGRIVQHQPEDDLQRRPVRQAHFRLHAVLVGQEPGRSRRSPPAGCESSGDVGRTPRRPRACGG